MPLFAQLLKALPLAGAMLLAGCGGSGSDASDKRQAPRIDNPAPPVLIEVVKEPNVALFIARAQQAPCSGLLNKIYIVDTRYAFLARKGECGDASYAYELFGATPDLPLCSKADSIAGEQKSCKDEGMRALFDTMVANLDKADLGLGTGHKVEPVAFVQKDPGLLAFDIVVSEAFSGVRTARNVVIKDQKTLTDVWADHLSVMTVQGEPAAASTTPARPVPVVDFSTKMVIAAFAGNSGGCYRFGIRTLSAQAGKIVAAVENRGGSASETCIAAITAPMQMIVLDRSTAAVEFTVFSEEAVPFTVLGDKVTSLLSAPASHLVRDQAAWASLWQAHRPSEPLPQVDFSKRMVIAYFLGYRPNGCHDVVVSGVSRAGGKIHVDLVEFIPAAYAACTLSFINPYAMVTVDRSEEALTFRNQVRQYR